MQGRMLERLHLAHLQNDNSTLYIHKELIMVARTGVIPLQSVNMARALPSTGP